MSSGHYDTSRYQQQHDSYNFVCELTTSRALDTQVASEPPSAPTPTPFAMPSHAAHIGREHPRQWQTVPDELLPLRKMFRRNLTYLYIFGAAKHMALEQHINSRLPQYSISTCFMFRPQHVAPRSRLSRAWLRSGTSLLPACHNTPQSRRVSGAPQLATTPPQISQRPKKNFVLFGSRISLSPHCSVGLSLFVDIGAIVSDHFSLQVGSAPRRRRAFESGLLCGPSKPTRVTVGFCSARLCEA